MVIAQSPNKPIIVAFIAAIIGRLVANPVYGFVRAVFYIAIIIWAYEEIIHGVNWFRRGLGGVVMLYSLVSLGFLLAH